MFCVNESSCGYRDLRKQQVTQQCNGHGRQVSTDKGCSSTVPNIKRCGCPYITVNGMICNNCWVPLHVTQPS